MSAAPAGSPFGWRALQELARRVVGEHLAARLARRAVVHGVAEYSTARIVSPHTGHGSPVRPCTPAGRSFDELMSSRPRSYGEVLGDSLADRRHDRRRAVEAELAASSRTATAWRGGTPRWRGGGRSRRPPAGRAGTRGCASTAGRRSGRRARRARSVAASGPSLSSGDDVSTAAVGTHHTPARRSVPCSVSSSAGAATAPSGRTTKRAWPPRGLADCFASTSSRPPCIRWTTNVDRLEREQQVLAASADRPRAGCRTPCPEPARPSSTP